MVAAVSTACFYPLETETALKTLPEAGVRVVEIFINTEREIEEPFLKLIKRMLADYGAEVYSVHLHTSGFEPLSFFSLYRRRFYDSIERYNGYFRAAAFLGAHVVVFHGDRKEGRVAENEYFERFAAVSDAAAREGIILAQENVSRCRSGQVTFIQRMREYLGPGAAKFVFDVKQARRAGENPAAMLKAMGEDIVNVHISGSAPGSDCVPPGPGSGDFIWVPDALRGYGYKGPLIIEVYRESFRGIDEIKTSFDYVDSLL